MQGVERTLTMSGLACRLKGAGTPGDKPGGHGVGGVGGVRSWDVQNHSAGAVDLPFSRG